MSKWSNSLMVNLPLDNRQLNSISHEYANSISFFLPIHGSLLFTFATYTWAMIIYRLKWSSSDHVLLQVHYQSKDRNSTSNCIANVQDKLILNASFWTNRWDVLFKMIWEEMKNKCVNECVEKLTIDPPFHQLAAINSSSSASIIRWWIRRLNNNSLLLKKPPYPVQ